MPGFDVINQDSLSPSRADIGKARSSWGRPSNPKKKSRSPQRLARPQGNRDRGPGHLEGDRDQRDDQGAGVGAVPRVPGPAADDVDVYRLGWIGDYVDPMNFLELWTSGRGTTTRTSATRIRPADRAGTEHRRHDARYALYRQAEAMLTGPGARCRSSRSTGTRTRTSSGSPSRTPSRSTCSTSSTSRRSSSRRPERGRDTAAGQSPSPPGSHSPQSDHGRLQHPPRHLDSPGRLDRDFS